MAKFEKFIEVRWSDVDQNKHVRHSAYNDYGAYVRIRFISEHGFDTDKLDQLKIGPILFKEECSFIREVRPSDTIRINILNDKTAQNNGRWKIHHELFNQNDEKVAHITVNGGWLDLEKRRLVSPPDELAKAFSELPTGEDYVYRKTS